MDKFSVINLNNFTWYLNIAIFGGVFAVFSLIYNEGYIYYGFITFVFGVLGHIIYKFFGWITNEGKEDEKYNYFWILHISHLFLATAWIITMINVQV